MASILKLVITLNDNKLKSEIMKNSPNMIMYYILKVHDIIPIILHKTTKKTVYCCINNLIAFEKGLPYPF